MQLKLGATYHVKTTSNNLSSNEAKALTKKTSVLGLVTLKSFDQQRDLAVFEVDDTKKKAFARELSIYNATQLHC